MKLTKECGNASKKWQEGPWKNSGRKRKGGNLQRPILGRTCTIKEKMKPRFGGLVLIFRFINKLQNAST